MAEAGIAEAKAAEYTPGPDAVDITPDKDGGVLKEIKTPGKGEDGPQTGDKVLVHYVGTLMDGSKFDSSRERGQMFEFDLGQGSVIKAWDIGVATMKRGELAVLTCRGDYAYGETGSPPKIPPNATLVFEVELFDWKGEDLTSDKDGGVTRSVITKGEGFSSPNEGASCEIHLVGKYNDSVFEDRDVSFAIGEGADIGLVEGVELAVKKLHKGGKSKVQIKSKYAYGADGNKDFNIPPHADLVYEVELKNFEKAKESWEMDSAEKLEQATIMKEKGTANFKSGDFKKAIRMYTKIVDYLSGEDKLEGEEETKRHALMLAAHLNLAMCHLKLNDSFSGKTECDKALEMDEKNEKALFRRGTAKMNLKDYDEAIADFKIVLEIDPNNKAAKNQIIIAHQKIKDMQAKEKKLYGGMFQKFADIDSQHEKLNSEVDSPKEKGSEDANESLGEGGETNAKEQPQEEPEPIESKDTPSV